MKSIRQEKELLAAIFINVLFLIFVMSFFTPFYETSDDYTIRQFVDGSMGASSSRLVFFNVILGFALKSLYSLLPALPWYDILQYAIIFLSLTGLSWAVFKQMKHPVSIIFVLAFLFVFGLDAYVRVQFTKTAGLASACGLFLMLRAFEAGRNRSFQMLFGGALCLVGSMLRLLPALCCGAIMAFCALPEFISRYKASGSLKKALAHFKPFYFLIAAMLLCFCIDRLTYLDSRWAAYIFYNEARSLVMDFAIPKYYDFVNVYSELGISENLYTLLRTWCFYDTEIITADAFVQLAECIPPSFGPEGDTEVSAFFGSFMLPFASGWAFAGLLLCVCIYISVFSRWDRSRIISIFASLLMFLLLSLYLFYSRRHGIYRINFMLYLSLALCFVWYIPAIEKRSPIVSGAIFLLVSALILGKYWNYYSGMHAKDFLSMNGFEQGCSEEAMEYFSSTDALILDDLNMDKTYRDWAVPFRAAPKNVFDHMVALGGWDVNYPLKNDILEKYGVENPFRALAENEEILVVTDRIDMILGHIRQEYAPDAVYELVHEFSDSYPGDVYRILS